MFLMEYLLRVNYDNQVKYIPFVKMILGKMTIYLQGDIFFTKSKIVLNIVTLALIILNFNIYLKIKEHIKS